MRPMILGIVLVVCLMAISPAYAEQDPQIEMFSPQGTVKGVRQMSVRFSEQMVPFGDPRGITEPFEIDCPEKGTSRWADGKNWIYDFERDLPAGVRCQFRVKPGLKALSGKEIVGQKIFSFSTGGLAIKASYPYGGAEGIDEEQIFILTLDAEPAEESVLRHVTFSVEGIQDLISIRIVEGKEREEIFKAWFRYRKPPFPPMIFIQSKQRFPADTKLSLIWGKGVASKTGVATDKDQILRFKTRRPFLLEFSCERENPRAACIPITHAPPIFRVHLERPGRQDRLERVGREDMDASV